MPGSGSQCTVNGESHYQRNKQYYLDRVAARRNETRELLKTLKEQSGCVDCGNMDWRVLEFDHLPGNTKSLNLSKTIERGWSNKRILAEAAKCEVVCANCHRVRTHERNASVA